MKRDTKKLRLKCANCGMLYDIYIDEKYQGDPLSPKSVCPKCGSNACDKINPDNMLEYR